MDTPQWYCCNESLSLSLSLSLYFCHFSFRLSASFSAISCLLVSEINARGANHGMRRRHRLEQVHRPPLSEIFKEESHHELIGGKCVVLCQTRHHRQRKIRHGKDLNIQSGKFYCMFSSTIGFNGPNSIFWPGSSFDATRRYCVDQKDKDTTSQDKERKNGKEMERQTFRAVDMFGSWSKRKQRLVSTVFEFFASVIVYRP